MPEQVNNGRCQVGIGGNQTRGPRDDPVPVNLVDLLVHAIRLGLRFDDLVALNQGADLLFHLLEDSQGAAPDAGNRARRIYT